MNSRTLVIKTLEFADPERTPRQAWILPWAEARHPVMVRLLRERYPDDIVTAPAVYLRPPTVSGQRYGKGEYTDEWGCRFKNLHDGVIGVVKEPLLSDWNRLDDFQAPHALLDLDRRKINRYCKNSDRFVLAGTLIRPFERLGFLRGMEKLLVDLALQPPGLSELLARVHQHYLKECEAWCSTNIDALYLMDDWGTQHGLMIAPDLWRRQFKPLYRDYADIAAAAGKYLFMHSDGNILPIIGDLIEVGVQALNCQVACMGIPELGKYFRGEITFWGEVDRQQQLPYGSREDIQNTVRELYTHLSCRGGVIAQCEFGPGAKPENVLQVFQAWQSISSTAKEEDHRC